MGGGLIVAGGAILYQICFENITLTRWHSVNDSRLLRLQDKII